MRRLFFLLLSLFLLLPAFAGAALDVYFLDVGQGDAGLVICDGEAMLIDGGKPEASQLIYTVLTGDRGLSHLSYLVATHPHSDHVGGLSAALTACTVSHVYSPVYYYNDPVFLRFRDMIRERGLTLEMPLPGYTVSLGGAKVTFLAPSKLFGDMNDNSLCLRVDYGDTSLLFTGDAEVPEERDMLTSALPLQADVLKVGHHGSASSTSQEFLEAVSPQYALIGVGADNTYGHPAPEVLARLKAQGIQLYRTDFHGQIHLHSDGTGFTLIPERMPTDENEIYTRSWGQTAMDAVPDTLCDYYVGNIKSMRFHRPECEGAVKMSEKNRIILDSREEAISAGYMPCGTCKP